MFILILGFLVGFLISFIPGFHPNNVANITSISSDESFFYILALYAANSLLALSTAAIFLVTDDRTGFLQLPFQKLTRKKSFGYAIALLMTSSVISLFFTLLVSPLMMFLYPNLNGLVFYMPIFVACFSAYAIVTERNSLIALLYFLLTGVVGYFALSSLKQPHLVMFSSLFGLPTCVLFLLSNPSARVSLNLSHFKWSIRFIMKKPYLIAVALFLSFIAELIPAVSSDSQLAFLASPFVSGDASMLVLVSSISSSHQLTTLVALSSIQTTRTGLAKNISLHGIPSAIDFFLYVILACTALGLGIFFLRGIDIKHLKPLALLGITTVFVIIFLTEGSQGVIFFTAFSLLGFFPMYFHTRRFTGMGCIIFPYLINHLL